MRYRTARQLSTGRLLQALLTTDSPDGFSVPAVTHALQLAQVFGLNPADVAAVDSDQPPDLTNAIPSPVPPTPDDVLERVAASTLTLPTFAQIDTIVDTLFPALTDTQRTFLKRLAKLVRALVQRTI